MLVSVMEWDKEYQGLLPRRDQGAWAQSARLGGGTGSGPGPAAEVQQVVVQAQPVSGAGPSVYGTVVNTTASNPVYESYHPPNP